MNRFVIWKGGLKSHPFLRHRKLSEDVGTAGKDADGRKAASRQTW